MRMPSRWPSCAQASNVAIDLEQHPIRQNRLSGDKLLVGLACVCNLFRCNVGKLSVFQDDRIQIIRYGQLRVECIQNLQIAENVFNPVEGQISDLTTTLSQGDKKKWSRDTEPALRGTVNSKSSMLAFKGC